MSPEINIGIEQEPKQIITEFQGITPQVFLNRILAFISTEPSQSFINEWRVETQAFDPSDKTKALKAGVNPDSTRRFYEMRKGSEYCLVLATTTLETTNAESLTSDMEISDSLFAFMPLRSNNFIFDGHSENGFSIFIRHIPLIFKTDRTDHVAKSSLKFNQHTQRIDYKQDGAVTLIEPDPDSHVYTKQQKKVRKLFEKIKQTLEAESEKQPS